MRAARGVAISADVSQMAAVKGGDGVAQPFVAAVEGVVVGGEKEVKAGIGEGIEILRRLVEARIPAEWRRADGCLKVDYGIVS